MVFLIVPAPAGQRSTIIILECNPHKRLLVLVPVITGRVCSTPLVLRSFHGGGALVFYPEARIHK